MSDIISLNFPTVQFSFPRKILRVIIKGGSHENSFSPTRRVTLLCPQERASEGSRRCRCLQLAEEGQLQHPICSPPPQQEAVKQRRPVVALWSSDLMLLSGELPGAASERSCFPNRLCPPPPQTEGLCGEEGRRGWNGKDNNAHGTQNALSCINGVDTDWN